MKRLIFWLVLVLILAGSGGAAYFAFPNYWHPNPADHFRMQSVTEGDIISVVNSTGTVQPVLSVQIGSFVSGPIKTADVDFNSRVKEGDILASIDPRTYEANVARDEAALAFRVADKERVAALLEQAQHNEQRALALRKTKSTFISDAEIDQFLAERKSFDAQLKVAAASVKEAEAALSLSKANLGYTVIKSPVDGVVIDRKVDPGQTVAAAFQTPVLFIVAPNMEKEMYVYASVDEADIGFIRQAKDRKQPVTFSVDAYSDDLFSGSIYQIRLNPTTVQNVVTYTVVVSAANSELKLLPGMTASLSFQIEKHPSVRKVPNAAVRYYPRMEDVREADRPLLEGTISDKSVSEQPTVDRLSAEEKVEAARTRNRRHVWVVRDGKLAAVEIKVGLSDNNYTELVDGDLKPGQPLVVGVKNPVLGP